MSRKGLIEEAWRRGLISPLLLDSNQLTMHDWLEAALLRNRLIVVNKSRQLGGSFWVLVEAVSLALRQPGAQIKYAAQTQKQVRKILRPHLRAIFKTCPEEHRPRFHSQDGEYRFPTGAPSPSPGATARTPRRCAASTRTWRSSTRAAPSPTSSTSSTTS